MSARVRRLAAILFSDMRGYSRQMGQDELGALERLEEHNRILSAGFARHGGRIIKTVGDAFMVEFASSVAAVTSALEIQQELAQRNAGRAPAEHIEVRIGVHVGDVVVQDGDLFGDAVNLAARLEPCAGRGEVCVSEAVFEQVRRRLRARARDLGRIELKNMPEPVHLYCLVPGDNVLELPATDGQAALVRSRPSGRRLAAILGLLIASGSLVVLWRWWGPGAHEATGTPSLLIHRQAPTSQRAGGTLRLGFPSERGRFDPFSTLRATLSRFAMELTLEHLAAPDSDGNPVPLALDHWEQRSDTRLALFLRRDLVFHDHPCFDGGVGRPATDEDLAFSLALASRHALPPLPLAGAAEIRDGGHETLEGISFSDAGWLEVHLAEPSPYPDDFLLQVPLLPRELGSCDGEDVRGLRRPVGTGPFRFDREPSGESLQLVRSDNYRGADAGHPRLASMDLRYKPDEAAGLLELRQGKLDMMFLERARPEWTPAKPVVADVPANSGLRVVVVPGHDTTTLYNLHIGSSPRPPLDSPLVRRAVALALSRREILEASPWFARPSGRFLEPKMLGSELGTQELAGDVVEARALVRRAGAAGQMPISLVVPDPALEVASRLVVEDLRQVGLQATLVRTSPTVAYEALQRGEARLIIFGLQTNVRGKDPYRYLHRLIATLENGGYGNPRVLELARRMRAEPSRDRRTALYSQLERALLDELPVVPLGFYDSERPLRMAVASSRVRGAFDDVTGYLSPRPAEWATVAWLDSTSAR